jgi:hypothetical protein
MGEENRLAGLFEFWCSMFDVKSKNEKRLRAKIARRESRIRVLGLLRISALSRDSSAVAAQRSRSRKSEEVLKLKASKRRK